MTGASFPEGTATSSHNTRKRSHSLVDLYQEYSNGSGQRFDGTQGVPAEGWHHRAVEGQFFFADYPRLSHFFFIFLRVYPALYLSP